MKKRYSQLIETFIFTGLVGLIGFLMATGKAGIYLHPKMGKYLIFAFVILLTVDVLWVVRLFSGKEKPRKFKMSYLIFVLPLMVGIMNPNQISGAVLQNKTVSVMQSMASNNKVPEPVTATQEEETTPVTPEATTTALEAVTEAAVQSQSQTEAEVENAPPTSQEATTVSASEVQEKEAAPETQTEKATEAQTQEVTETEAPPATESVPLKQIGDKGDDPFYDLMTSIYTNPDLWMGEAVSVEGFVFREEGYHGDTLVLSRLVMACCAADAYVVGLFVKDPAVKDLPNDGWFKIEGVIAQEAIYNPFTESYDMNPVIKPTTITAIEPYATPYVYPAQ